MKHCPKCKIDKKLPENFRKSASQKDGFDYWCKTCRSNWEKEWRVKNPEKAVEINRRNYLAHRGARILAAAEYRKANESHLRDASKANEREREFSDLNFKMRRRIRLQIRNAILNGGSKKSEGTEMILGCSIEQLKERLAAEFNGTMGWENWGPVWEIGHKKPVASFDLRDPEQQKECWHFSNLFPHLREQNRKDGAKYEGVDFQGLCPADFEIVPVPLAQTKNILTEHHYSHSVPSAATMCFGLVSTVDKRLIGASVWRPAALGPAKKLSPVDPQAVLCLSRFVLVPGIPYNTASYFLSGCIRQIKHRKEFNFLVTYADTWRGHDGCIYKASNWKFEGYTDPQPVWTLNDKLIGKRRGKASLTKQNLQDMGAVFHGNFSKIRFTYQLR